MTYPIFSAVYTQTFDGSQVLGEDQLLLRLNGVDIGKGDISAGITSINNQAIHLFRNGSTNYLLGNLYGCILRGAITTDELILETEEWLDGKTP